MASCVIENHTIENPVTENVVDKEKEEAEIRRKLVKKEKNEEKECKKACLAIFSDMGVTNKVPLPTTKTIYVYWLNLLLSVAHDKVLLNRTRMGCSYLHRMETTDKRNLVMFHAVQTFYQYLIPLFNSTLEEKENGYFLKKIFMDEKWKTSVLKHASEYSSLYDVMTYLIEKPSLSHESYEVCFNQHATLESDSDEE